MQGGFAMGEQTLICRLPSRGYLIRPPIPLWSLMNRCPPMISSTPHRWPLMVPSTPYHGRRGPYHAMLPPLHRVNKYAAESFFLSAILCTSCVVPFRGAWAGSGWVGRVLSPGTDNEIHSFSCWAIMARKGIGISHCGAINMTDRYYIRKKALIGSLTNLKYDKHWWTSWQNVFMTNNLWMGNQPITSFLTSMLWFLICLFEE